VMPQRTLGQKLRAILLTTPLIAAPGCGLSTGPPVCHTLSGTAYGTEISALPFIDGGTVSDCTTACDLISAHNCGLRLKSLDSCAFLALSDGGPGVSCMGNFVCGGCTGRRPASLLAAVHSQSPHALGAHYAEAARLEAASIPAFRFLARELRMHGSPTHLVEVALRSAHDEVRHARATASLARRYGAAPLRPRFGEEPAGRGLEAIAMENAMEGCVRESYGALVALWQARHARDPAIASAMAPIAADELRHAELAWEVAAWAEPRLSRSARARVIDARDCAFAELSDETALPVPPALVALAGLPPAETARTLVGHLSRATA
jgi:hypothetical protein